MSRHPVSKKRPTRRRRPERKPPVLEVHHLEGGIKVTRYPAMVEFSLDQTAVRQLGKRRPQGGGA
jgi:hypothetical protein